MHVLSTERRAEVVRHLIDGAGVRTASRQTGTHKTTISKLTLNMGTGCRWLHNGHVRDVNVGHAQLDEMHSFIHTREQNLRGDEPKEWGESWLWLAVASTSKLIISYRVGETRGEKDADALIKDFRGRLNTVPIVSTDGLDSYVGPIRRWFGGVGGGIQYAQIVKNFKRKGKDYDRYAPSKEKPFITKRGVFGDPDVDEASTSFVERTNLTVRTCLRRFVRRGSGHSKSLAHHEAMIAIFVMYFNFCRIHETLRITPAMQAGLSDHVWSIEELVEAAMNAKPCDPPEPRPLAPLPEEDDAVAAPKTVERTTTTGNVLRLVGKGKVKKPRPQVTVWDVLREAKRREEQGKTPPDTPPKGAPI